MNPTKYIIINARNTDGYTIVREYADGSQDSGSGYYQTIEAAFEDCTVEEAQIVNGTTDWTNDEARATFGVLFDA